MKFSELSSDAQKKAVNDYILGWLETHPEEANEIDYNWGFEICIDDNDTDYDINGNVI